VNLQTCLCGGYEPPLLQRRVGKRKEKNSLLVIFRGTVAEVLLYFFIIVLHNTPRESFEIACNKYFVSCAFLYVENFTDYERREDVTSRAAAQDIKFDLRFGLQIVLCLTGLTRIEFTKICWNTVSVKRLVI
jgi:hypothetical protein